MFILTVSNSVTSNANSDSMRSWTSDMCQFCLQAFYEESQIGILPPRDLIWLRFHGPVATCQAPLKIPSSTTKRFYCLSNDKNVEKLQLLFTDFSDLNLFKVERQEVSQTRSRRPCWYQHHALDSISYPGTSTTLYSRLPVFVK